MPYANLVEHAAGAVCFFGGEVCIKQLAQEINSILPKDGGKERDCPALVRAVPGSRVLHGTINAQVLNASEGVWLVECYQERFHGFEGSPSPEPWDKTTSHLKQFVGRWSPDWQSMMSRAAGGGEPHLLVSLSIDHKRADHPYYYSLFGWYLTPRMFWGVVVGICGHCGVTDSLGTSTGLWFQVCYYVLLICTVVVLMQVGVRVRWT
jgi:hypothetical protein